MSPMTTLQLRDCWESADAIADNDTRDVVPARYWCLDVDMTFFSFTERVPPSSLFIGLSTVATSGVLGGVLA